MAEALSFTSCFLALTQLMLASLPVEVSVIPPSSSQFLRPSSLAAVDAFWFCPLSARPLFTAEVIQEFCAQDFPKTTPKVNIKITMTIKIIFFIELKFN